MLTYDLPHGLEGIAALSLHLWCPASAQQGVGSRGQAPINVRWPNNEEHSGCFLHRQPRVLNLEDVQFRFIVA